MVLREVEEAAPDDSDPFASPTDDPSSDPDAPTITLPDGRRLPVWLVPTVRSLFQQNPGQYPNPFTPIPIYARLIGYSEAWRDASVVTDVNRTQLYANRKLTPLEVQAETYYHSLLYQYLYKSEAFGVTCFLALAAFRANAAKTKPGFITPYAKRWMGDKVGGLYITISRYGIYGLLGRLQGQVIGALVGSNKMKQMTQHDPNVQDLRKDLAEFRYWAQAELARKIQQRKEGGPKEPLIPTTEEIATRYHPKRGGEHAERSGDGMFDEHSATDHSNNDTDQTTQYPYRRPTLDSSSSSSSSLSSSSSTNSPPPADLLSSLYSPDSDPSGTSPSSRGNAHPGGESTWERIRRERLQNSPSPGGSRSGVDVPADEQTARMPKTDSFTFSDSDQERQLAQAEAQRDFDARVERERRGERGWGSGR